jgi:beta-glucosidase-like glycosyl hydrolase
MKVLKFEDLSLEQKLGMVSCGYVLKDSDWEDFDSNLEYTLDAIRNHRLGSVWMSHRTKSFKYAIEKIKEVADYPVLIFTDAESGIGEFMIGKHNALGSTDNEEYAYTFGKVVGVTARKMGYNIVCDPVLDAHVGSRYIGTDKEKVVKLGAAMARGLHDAGILNVAKHYPSAHRPDDVDTHMAPAISYQTEEELIKTSLYPYIELNKQGLINGIMTGHVRMDNIDKGMPASLSRKVIDIIKNQGFDGFFVTDGLRMMSVRSEFGDIDPKGMCIEAGNTVALDWEYT